MHPVIHVSTCRQKKRRRNKAILRIENAYFKSYIISGLRKQKTNQIIRKSGIFCRDDSYNLKNDAQVVF